MKDYSEYEIIDMIMKLQLKNTTKLIFVAIARKLDWKTWSKPMSISYIHMMIGGSVSTRSISRALVELQELELINRSTSKRSDNTRAIILNVDQLVTVSQSPSDTMSDLTPCHTSDTMSDLTPCHTSDTMSDLTPCHTSSDTMSDPPLTPCHTSSDTMSDNILYNTLNNTLDNTLDSPEQRHDQVFTFKPEPVKPDDDYAQKLNAHFEKQRYDAMIEERRARDKRIRLAQERKINSYR